MQATFTLSCVGRIENLLSWNVLSAEKLHHSVDVTSFAKIKKGSHFSLSLSSYARLCVPFQIKLALAQSCNYLELVTRDPVFLCVLFEVEGEVWLYHRAGQLFGTQAAETFLHKLMDNMLVCVIRGYNIVPSIWNTRFLYFLFTSNCCFFLLSNSLRFVFRGGKFARSFNHQIDCLRLLSRLLEFVDWSSFCCLFLRCLIETIVFVVRHNLNSN